MMSLLVIAGLLLLSLPLFLRLLRRSRRRLPPGPRGLPIVGNVWGIPAAFDWLTYTQWGRDYNSDIIYFRPFGTPVIILNSAKAAYDLFERRSALYSDRVHQVMAAELAGWSGNTAFFPYGDRWREHRRIIHQHFYPGAVKNYHHILSRKAKMLLQRLLTRPAEFMDHLKHMPAAAILVTTYGFKIQEHNDPWLTTAEEAMLTLDKLGNAGAYLVDYLPFLRYVPTWMPGAQFKRDAEKWKKPVIAMYEEPLRAVQQDMMKGDVKPSIAASLLADLDPNEDNSERISVIQNAIGTSYAAGTDTVAGSLCSFALAMALYPDVRRRAQEELDGVIGRDRLPELTDRESLPYTSAIAQETLRWHPVAPLGVPHRLLADDEYNGYHFPAGSIVIGNYWAISRDQNLYSNPDIFDPSRYLTAEGRFNERASGILEAPFGYGKRICPGRHFAMDTLWIAIAHILATFDITKAVDEYGQVVEPKEEYSMGLVSRPLPYEVDFKARSEAAEALISSLSFD